MKEMPHGEPGRITKELNTSAQLFEDVYALYAKHFGESPASIHSRLLALLLNPKVSSDAELKETIEGTIETLHTFEDALLEIAKHDLGASDQDLDALLSSHQVE